MRKSTILQGCVTNPFLVHRDRPRKPDGIYREIVSEQTFSVLVRPLILVKQPNQYELQRNIAVRKKQRDRFSSSSISFERVSFFRFLAAAARVLLPHEREGEFI